jgi:hypothetical protein
MNYFEISVLVTDSWLDNFYIFVCIFEIGGTQEWDQCFYK